MDNIKGTPTTLVDAIHNGIDDVEYSFPMALQVEKHVVDFLNQKFTIAMLKHSEAETALVELLEMITGKRIGK